MNKDSNPILSGSFAKIQFPLPKELQHIGLYYENIDHAIEYYLLSRYSYLHRMNYSFMINSFWTTEYLILAILTLKYETKNSLLKEFKPHKLTEYWRNAKTIIPKKLKEMEKFDNYIGDIQGYFNERYPEKNESKLIRSPDKIQIFNHENKRVTNFSKTYILDIDKLDKFTSFMLNDILNYSSDNLQEKLASFDSLLLYRNENKYSMIYPNRKYPKQN